MKKVVWVTSDNAAIGTALCQAFASQGYRVNILQFGTPLPSPATATSHGATASYQPIVFDAASLVDTDAIQHWLGQQQAQTGPADTLLHVAATLDSAYDTNNLRTMLDVVHAGMIQRQHGRIILVLPAHHSDSPNTSDLSNNWIRGLAQQGLGQGVTVNAIRASLSSTVIETPDSSSPATAKPANDLSKLDAPSSVHLGQAEEVANLALWLASAEAASLTGATFVINGPH